MNYRYFGTFLRKPFSYSSSRFKATNDSIFNRFKGSFAINQGLDSLAVQVFLQQVYSVSGVECVGFQTSFLFF